MAKPKKSYHHGDLRHSLLLAAEKLLEQNGVGAVSLRDVAKKAGVSHTAPYRHFVDKQALLAGLANVGFGRLADAMEQCVTTHPQSPREQLSASAHAYVGLAIRHPQMTNLMFGGVLAKDECPEELAQQSDRAFNGLLRIIKNGQQAGLYIEKESMDLALFVWSLAHGFSMLISAGQLGNVVSDEKLVQDMVSNLSGMVATGIVKRE